MQEEERLEAGETMATEQNYEETVAVADVIKFLLGIRARHDTADIEEE